MANEDRTTMPLRAKLPLAAVGAALAGIAAWTALRRRILVWGATPEETRRPLPGDDLIGAPLYATTRAITVRAPISAVWPWLVQLGQNRGGFYSYDFLENLAGLDIHSADTIHPEWQDPRPGEDFLTLDPEATMTMTVAVMDRERAFVVRSGAPGEPPQPPGDFFRGEIACTWGFYLEPLTDEATRLIIRWRAAWTDTRLARVARPLLLEPMHFFMEERMLRGIRDRAERSS